MRDLDARLSSLRLIPDDPRIDGLEESVMNALALRRSSDVALTSRGLGMAACFALIIGFAVSVVPASQSVGVQVAPFGAPTALAPSTLLGSG